MSYRGFDVVVGIEIHVQLSTKSKIFCADPTNFDAGDNENTSPVSVGMPGALPVLNKVAVEYSIKTGLALGCHINERSVFARKNYFYPDSPKGYQISQHDEPLCVDGLVRFKLNGEEKTVSIHRAHMEEDAGKSTHSGECSLINYNRSGIPLLEIVSGPDMTSPAEAAEYARTVRQIVRYLGVCDGNLEEGSLRCDCNVSIKPAGQKELGTKVEIKNINSFRFIEKAIEYEIHRQIDCSERGEPIVQETRLWDPDRNRTFSMRTKEDAEDYRYFSDPDLLPLVVTSDMIDNLRRSLPELPLLRAERLQREHNLPEADALSLTVEKPLADYYEQVVAVSGNAKASANWILTELLRELNAASVSIERTKISAKNLGDLILMIDQGKISGKIAKAVFQDMWNQGKAPQDIVKDKGLVQISDPQKISEIIDDVLASQQNAVNEYRTGKKKNLFGFFVGAVMKASKGQANPDLVNQILMEKLK